MPPDSFTYERWRHGGWYVYDVRYFTGAVGCVSRNYDDRKWRIACDPRPFDQRPTFRTRDDAARAEWLMVQDYNDRVRRFLNGVSEDPTHPATTLATIALSDPFLNTAMDRRLELDKLIDANVPKVQVGPVSPILHVRITDQDGREVADVDASSTADALAYFLDNRSIEPGATVHTVRRKVLSAQGASYDLGARVPASEPITYPVRDGFEAFTAEVH